MFFKGRFLFFLLILGLFALMFRGVGGRSAYQDAYWQGYSAGLAADGESAAPAPPPPGYYAPKTGFFGFFFPFIFLLFGLAFLGKLFMGRRYWAHHHGRHGKGPWSRHHGHGPWGKWQHDPGEKGPEDIDDMPDGEVRAA